MAEEVGKNPVEWPPMVGLTAQMAALALINLDGEVEEKVQAYGDLVRTAMEDLLGRSVD